MKPDVFNCDFVDLDSIYNPVGDSYLRAILSKTRERVAQPYSDTVKVTWIVPTGHRMSVTVASVKVEDKLNFARYILLGKLREILSSAYPEDCDVRCVVEDTKTTNGSRYFESSHTITMRNELRMEKETDNG